MRRLTNNELLQIKASFNVLKEKKFYTCFFLKNKNKCEVVVCESGLVYIGRRGQKVFDVVEVLATTKESGNALYRKFKTMENASKSGFKYINL